DRADHRALPSFPTRRSSDLAYLPYYTEAQFVAADRGSRSISRVTADQAEGIQAHGRMIPFDQMITPAAIRTARERATSSDDFLRSEEHTSELQSRSDLVCRL